MVPDTVAAPSSVLPLYTFTLDPDSLVPERTSAVSSVVSPLESAPVTVPTLSVAAVKFAVAAVESITIVLEPDDDHLPAASSSWT